jgi:lipopolysaccharide transport system permease protein
VPPLYRGWLGLNPVAGVIEGFRWAMLGDHFHSLRIIGLSAISATVIFVTGLILFTRFQESFADVL